MFYCAQIKHKGSGGLKYKINGDVQYYPLLPIKTHIYPYRPLLPTGPSNINIILIFCQPCQYSLA